MKKMLSVISLCLFGVTLVGSNQSGSDVTIVFDYGVPKAPKVIISPLQQKMNMAIENGDVEAAQGAIDDGYNVEWSDVEKLRYHKIRTIAAHSRLYAFCFRIGYDAGCNRATEVIAQKCTAFIQVKGLMQKAWKGKQKVFETGF